MSLFNRRRTYPLKDRKHLVSIESFCKPMTPDGSFMDFVDSLPDHLAAKAIKGLAQDIVTAHSNDQPVIIMLGGHVIKTGCAPAIIPLIRNGIITCIAMNGATAIHDFEIAICGGTSEDVGENLDNGTFGMWEETGRWMNEAVKEWPISMGQAYGKKLAALGKLQTENGQQSLIVAAYKANIPLTVHVAIGTDIIHQHPAADGRAIGEASFNDFRIFTEQVERLADGGVIINMGSAVLLPEVFLKAVAICRNAGSNVSGFVAANMDMIRQYRPMVNVLGRPVGDGKRYHIQGCHSVMVPLLCGIVNQMTVTNHPKHPQ